MKMLAMTMMFLVSVPLLAGSTMKLYNRTETRFNCKISVDWSRNNKSWGKTKSASSTTKVYSANIWKLNSISGPHGGPYSPAWKYKSNKSGKAISAVRCKPYGGEELGPNGFFVRPINNKGNKEWEIVKNR